MLPTEALFKLHAQNGEEFDSNGERDRMDRILARICPDMSHDSRRRVSRQIGRGLTVCGREAINLAIDDLETFEARLDATPFGSYGYKESFGSALKNAVRHLHVAARDGDADDVPAVRNPQRRRRVHSDAVEPLPIRSKKTRTKPDRTASRPERSGPKRKTSEQKAKAVEQPSVHGLPSAPTVEDVDQVLAQLASLQRKLGHWDAPAREQVSAMLLETLSDHAVIQLLAVLGGYQQPVSVKASRAASPTLSSVARHALQARLTERCARH